MMGVTAGVMRRYSVARGDVVFGGGESCARGRPARGRVLPVACAAPFAASRRRAAPSDLHALRNKWSFLSCALPVGAGRREGTRARGRGVTKGLKDSPTAFAQVKPERATALKLA